MKNVWTIIGAALGLYVLYYLWQSYSAAGGLAGILGTSTASTAAVAAVPAGAVGSAAYTPLGNYPNYTPPQQLAAVAPNNKLAGVAPSSTLVPGGWYGPGSGQWGPVSVAPPQAWPSPIGIVPQPVGPARGIFGLSGIQAY